MSATAQPRPMRRCSSQPTSGAIAPAKNRLIRSNCTVCCNRHASNSPNATHRARWMYFHPKKRSKPVMA